MKRCFKCNREKPITEFYKHSGMADGHLGKCKDCTKADMAKDYIIHRDRIVAYEKTRTKDPNRRKKRIVYQREMRLREVEKYKARQIAGNAVRNGRLIKKPCSVKGCNNKSQMHHDDYSKPLKITWLCRKHHMLAENKIPF
jgi:predicted ABC-class ATPase